MSTFDLADERVLLARHDFTALHDRLDRSLRRRFALTCAAFATLTALVAAASVVVTRAPAEPCPCDSAGHTLAAPVDLARPASPSSVDVAHLAVDVAHRSSPLPDIATPRRVDSAAPTHVDGPAHGGVAGAALAHVDGTAHRGVDGAAHGGVHGAAHGGVDGVARAAPGLVDAPATRADGGARDGTGAGHEGARAAEDGAVVEGEGSRLRVQLALYDDAERALAIDPARAFEIAGSLRARFPDGPLVVEAGLLRARVLVARKDFDGARAMLTDLAPRAAAAGKTAAWTQLEASLPPVDEDARPSRVLE